MDINDLRRQRETLKAEANALLTKEQVTDEDMAQAKAKLDEADKVQARVALLEKTQAGSDVAPLDGTNLTAEQRANMGKPFASLGEQLKAVAAAGDPQSPQIDRRLYAVRAATGLSENVPSDGGFLIQPDLISGLVQKAYADSQMISRCRKFAVGPTSNSIVLKTIEESSRADGSRWGGVRGYWEEEAASLTGSKPKFGEITVKLNKLTALCYATDEVLQDAVMLGSVIQEVFPKELRFKLQNALVRGTGAGQPLGVLNASGVLVSVAKETGQAADTVVFENIVKMWSRLYADCRPNAVWYINQDVEPSLFTMSLAVGTGGVPAYMPANGLAGSPYGTLFGRPVVPIEHADTVGDQGDVILADMGEYALADKGGVQAASSIHVQFTAAETVFRFIYRVGGQPLWKSYLTPFQSSNTLSPFVVLDARA